MGHAGHGKHKVAGKQTPSHGKGLGVRRHDLSKKKTKMGSTKNQIRSVERLLRKNLSTEAKDAQLKRLEHLKQQAEEHRQTELERKLALRYRKVKFFERRKIERSIKRLEKVQRAGDEGHLADFAEQLAQLKEDLEYVRFFPKTEKYVSLFMGNNDEEVIAKRTKLREQIKANLAVAAASGVEAEEMDIEEDRAIEDHSLVVSDDDFFLAGTSSDEAGGDDEWTFKSSKSAPIRDKSLKKQGPLSARHALPHKNQSKHERLGLNSKQRQPTGSTPRNKWSDSHDQRRQHESDDKNHKWSDSHDQRRQHKSEDKNYKKRKATMISPLSNHHNRGLESRNQPLPNTTSQMASLVPSSSKDPHSSIVTGIDSSNFDAQKKRRRKHRPKKKK